MCTGVDTGFFQGEGGYQRMLNLRAIKKSIKVILCISWQIMFGFGLLQELTFREISVRFTKFGGDKKIVTGQNKIYLDFLITKG